MKLVHSLRYLYLFIAILLLLGGVTLGSAPVFAQTGSVTAWAVPTDDEPGIGEQIVVDISIDVSAMDPPDQRLGSFSATLDWDPEVLEYDSHSGILAGFTGVVNDAGVSAGHLIFNGANASGATGEVVVLRITFDVIGAGTSALDLGYSAMAAASTFKSLLPLLTINDGQVVASPVTYTLAVDIVGNGTVSLDPAGGTYDAGTVVELEAIPAEGWQFSGWSGDLDGDTNPESITMNGDKVVTATFTEIPPEQYTLTVNTEGSGNVTLDPVGGTYDAGTVVELEAIPAEGWEFSGWSGDLDGIVNPRTITMNGDKVVTATFTEIPPEQYTLTVNTEGSGSVTLDPVGGTYDAGTVVELEAIPAEGWQFSGWSGDLDGETNPATLTMDEDKTVTAHFEQLPPSGSVTAWAVPTDDEPGIGEQIVVDISIDVSAMDPPDHWLGSFSATLDWDPEVLRYDSHSGILAGFTGVVNDAGASAGHLIFNGANASGATGEVVVLRITFDVIGAGTSALDLGYSAMAAASTFKSLLPLLTINDGQVVASPVTYTLAVDIVGNGTVSLDPAGGTYDAGTVVQLTAVPAAGWQFSGWSGDLDGDTNPESITMNGDKVVTATFTEIPPEQYTLTVNTEGSGNVTLDPAGGTYDAGTVVQLTAVPAEGWQFSGWSGDLDGIVNPRTITMNGDKDVIATFTEVVPEQYTLTVMVDPTGGGTTEPEVGEHTYVEGTMVDVTATPAAGYEFDHWSAACTGTGACQVMMDDNKTVTANFAKLTFSLEYEAGTGGSLDGEALQVVEYGEDGTAVEAIPDTGYQFAGWSDGSTANPRTDTNVTANVDVTANFAKLTFSLEYEAGTGGSLDGEALQVVEYGEDGTAVEAVPDTGYHFAGWSDGSTANPRTDTNVTADLDVTANFARITFSLEYTAGEGGSLTGNTSQTVAYGENGTAVEAVPDTGYQFVNWSDGSTANPRTDTNVTANVTVKANFAKLTFSLEYEAGTGGGLDGEALQVVEYGEDGTAVEAVPDTGYHFAGWSDGSTANPRTDTNVTADLDVTANFAVDTFTLEYEAGTGGSLTGNTSQTVAYGEDGTAVEAIPDTGYHFVNWSDGSTANPRTDTNVTANVAVTAHFEETPPQQYTITATAGPNGRINPSGLVTVLEGEDQSFTITPDSGYRVADVKVDGVSIGSVSSYTFTGVRANHTIQATFTRSSSARYMIIALAGPNGRINPSGLLIVSGGTSRQFSIQPSSGYQVKDVVVDGDSVGAVSSYTFTNISANHSIYALFERTTSTKVTITATAGPNGGISPSGQVQVLKGADQSFSITPDSGYQIADVMVDGVSVGPVPSYTFSNVQADHTIAASFEEISLGEYDLVVNVAGNGSVSLNPAGGRYVAGTQVLLLAMPEAGWKFSGWSGDIVGNTNPQFITMDGNKTVTALFTQITYELTLAAAPGSGGTTDPAVGVHTYLANQVVIITATPNAGYGFDHWSGACTGTGACQVTMDENKAVTAHFKLEIPANIIFVSSDVNGSVGGVSFADEDIVAYMPDTNRWGLFFDGSDVGLSGTDVDAFYLLDDSSTLLSLDRPIYLNGFGWVDDADIIKFIPTSLGSQTAGSFEWFFDGSDVGLDWGSEEVDAIGFTPAGDLVLSTIGYFGVPEVGGRDEDLVLFTPTSLGQDTRGTWSRYFDGSDVDLRNNSEDVHGVWVDDTGDIYLTTKGNYSVPGLSGDGADIFICHPTSLGEQTSCTFSLFWSGSDHGFAGKAVDAFSFSASPVLQTGLISAVEDDLAQEEVEPEDVPEEEDIPADDADDENDTDSDHDADDVSDGRDDRDGNRIFLPLITK